MQISFHTHYGGLDTTQGYGVAGYNIVKSLQELGHTTPFNDAGSPVMFNFTQPSYFQFNDGQYNIGYTPWESTLLNDNWANLMNDCSEMWTTSDWCKQVFKDNGVTAPMYVYPHGINHEWSPFRRRSNRVLRFLHHGEPAHRKGGQMVVNAFGELFGNKPGYELTLKANGFTAVRAESSLGIEAVDKHFKNVFIIKNVLDLPDLISLYKQHHVLLYPSYGEGFGFIPLQAMATGMPVIMTTTWAPYKNYSVGLDIKDRLVDTLWPGEHPGKVLEPTYESLKEQMIRAADDFETFSDQAFEFAPKIHDEYDWVNVTERAFAPIVKKFS